MEVRQKSHHPMSHPRSKISLSHPARVGNIFPLSLLSVFIAVFAVALLSGNARADTRTYKSATTTVSVPGTGTSGIAGTYPITTLVSNVQNQVVLKATVKLNGLTHSYPDDLDILLVAPDGTNLMLMSDAGSNGIVSNPINNVNLTFDDAAAAAIPDATQITTGTYKPANYLPGDNLPFPAPITSGATTLSVFNGLDPSGTWGLYINDDSGADVGGIGL